MHQSYISLEIHYKQSNRAVNILGYNFAADHVGNIGCFEAHDIDTISSSLLFFNL